MRNFLRRKYQLLLSIFLPEIHFFVVQWSRHLPATPGFISSNRTFILYVSSELQTHNPCVPRQCALCQTTRECEVGRHKKYLTKLIFSAQKIVHIAVIRVKSVAQKSAQQLSVEFLSVSTRKSLYQIACCQNTPNVADPIIYIFFGLCIV